MATTAMASRLVTLIHSLKARQLQKNEIIFYVESEAWRCSGQSERRKLGGSGADLPLPGALADPSAAALRPERVGPTAAQRGGGGKLRQGVIANTSK